LNRREFIQHLENAGCRLYRHGKRHDIYINPQNGKKSPLPRHVEIKNSLCRLICKQLGIDE
jgi:mRNA interferase HicA